MCCIFSDMGDSRGGRGRSRIRKYAIKLLRIDPSTYALLLLVIIPGQALWLFRGLDSAEKLSIEAIVIAVAAVVVALRHALGLDAMTGQLRDIAQSVPTGGIGIFPEYMVQVAELVSRVTESITIVCDTPAHGAFSNTPAFIKYHTELRHMMVDPHITIACAFIDAAGRREMHAAQIAADKEDWPSWQKHNRKNCEAFDRLMTEDFKLARPGNNGQGPVATWAETPEAYVESMMMVNEAVLASYDKRITINRLPFTDPLRDSPSVYVWLRDGDQEAVFVIVPVRGVGVRDLAGFHTREPALIRALGTVYEYLGDPEPIDASLP